MSFASSLVPVCFSTASPCSGPNAVTSCPCTDPSAVPVLQRESGGQLIDADADITFQDTLVDQPAGVFRVISPSRTQVLLAGIYRITYTLSTSSVDIPATAVQLRLLVTDASGTPVFSNDQTGGGVGVMSDNILVAVPAGGFVSVRAVNVADNGPFIANIGGVFNMERL